MTEPTPADTAVDAFVDLLMRGEAPDVAAFAAAHPELGPSELARLEKLARALGRSPRAGAAASGLPFETLGSYRLLERLGTGGMGIVYLAEDVRLGRRVALKIVRPELAASTDTLARFEREARAVAKLRHESIVTVFEAGRENGVPYLAMEFVHGQSLDQVYAGARHEHRHPPVEALIRWIRDVARALAAAHAAGIVHRDVKPSNVRVTPDGKALLLDFGLALDPDSASISRTGQLHGTLFYVSPEQVAGARVKVDARTDVWSLGVTFYEGLTGRVPFEGEHSEEILYRILTVDPIAPRELAPELSRDVETVVLTALEKDRERRYSSAAAFADDLDALLEHRPIRARPTGALTKAWKWSRRKPAHATTAVLALLLAVGGPLIYAIVQKRHSAALEIEKAAAIAQREIAESRARELEEMAAFQGRVLGQVQPQQMGAHVLTALRDEARAAWSRESLSEAELTQRLADFDRLLAPVNSTNVAVESLRHDVLEPALAAVSQHFADRPKVHGMLLHALGGTCWSLGLVELALTTQTKAFDILRASTPSDDRDTLTVEANLGWYLLSAGRAAEAEPHLRGAAEGLTRVLGTDHPSALGARHNLALLLRTLEQYDEAETLVREVLTTRRRVLGDDDPDTLTSLSNLGALLLVRERREEAEPVLREAYERRRRVLGPAAEATLTSANNLGVLYRDLGRLHDCEIVIQEAYDAARDAFGDLHPLTAFLLGSLAQLYTDNGCTDEAEAAFRRSIDASSAVSGALHRDTLHSVSQLGALLRKNGRRGEAETLLGNTYRDVCAAIGESHSDARSVVLQWAALLRDEKRHVEASELFARLAEATRESLGPEHARAQNYAAQQVNALVAAQRFAQAEAALDAARAALPSDSRPSNELVDAALALYTEWQARENAGEHADALARWQIFAR